MAIKKEDKFWKKYARLSDEEIIKKFEPKTASLLIKKRQLN